MLEFSNTYARTKPVEVTVTMESMALRYQEVKQGMVVSLKNIHEIYLKGAAIDLYSLFLQPHESSSLETPTTTLQTQAAICASIISAVERVVDLWGYFIHACIS
jgi:hypothetical protein